MSALTVSSLAKYFSSRCLFSRLDFDPAKAQPLEQLAGVLSNPDDYREARALLEGVGRNPRQIEGAVRFTGKSLHRKLRERGF